MIPTIENIDDISSDQLENLKTAGIFYIKLGSQEAELQKHLQTLNNQALDLFRSEQNIKCKYSAPKSDEIPWIKQTLTDGYIDRRNQLEHVETFRQPMERDILPPFQEYADDIYFLKDRLVNKLSVKILKKIVNTFSPSEQVEETCNIMNDLGSCLTFVYYPSKKTLHEKLRAKLGINPHKDICLLTLIMLQKPGLQCWADGRWIDVLPKNGYVVVLLGDILDLATDGNVRSCLHRVKMMNNEDRISTLLFVGSNKDLQKTVSGVNLEPDYIDKRYNKFNKQDHANFRRSFAILRKKINLTALVVFGLFLIITLKPNLSACYYFISLVLLAFILLNSFLQIFYVMHLRKRMLIDYLQYPTCPKSASESEAKAYQLGQSSLNFLGMLKSLLCAVTYLHTNFWNAGFISSFINTKK